MEWDRQRVWDQLLVRGWITEMSLNGCVSSFTELFGLHPVDAGLERTVVGASNLSPVRAFFNDQWPKLSAWLWKTKARERFTDAFEERVVRLLAQRRSSGKRRGYVNKSAQRSVRYYNEARRAAKFATIIREHAYHADSDWALTKPVRSK